MRIHGITEAFNAHFRRVQDTKRVSKGQKNARKTDASELSSAAQQLSKASTETSAVSAHLRVQPDVRQERIQEVRQKIQSGYYDTPGFRDELAKKLIKDFGWSPPQV